MSELAINVKKTINAPIEKVFDAWLSSETLSRFILPMPGMRQPEVTTDAYEGGCFTIIMEVGDDKIPHSGQYLEINRPNKLVFTWESPFSAEGSTVTLKFSEVGKSSTLVDLTHIKFPDEESRKNHEGGWSNILESLDDTFS